MLDDILKPKPKLAKKNVKNIPYSLRTVRDIFLSLTEKWRKNQAAQRCRQLFALENRSFQRKRAVFVELVT